MCFVYFTTQWLYLKAYSELYLFKFELKKCFPFEQKQKMCLPITHFTSLYNIPKHFYRQRFPFFFFFWCVARASNHWITIQTTNIHWWNSIWVHATHSFEKKWKYKLKQQQQRWRRWQQQQLIKHGKLRPLWQRVDAFSYLLLLVNFFSILLGASRHCRTLKCIPNVNKLFLFEWWKTYAGRLCLLMLCEFVYISDLCVFSVSLCVRIVKCVVRLYQIHCWCLMHAYAIKQTAIHLLVKYDTKPSTDWDKDKFKTKKSEKEWDWWR